MSATAPPPARRRVVPDLDQVLLRSLVLLGAAVSGVATQLAGARPHPWQQGLLLGLALLTALRPESISGIGVLGVAAYLWATGPDPRSPLVLAVAAGLVLTHVAALVAAQGPARMRVDPRQVGVWAVRAVVLWSAGASVWALGLLMEDLPPRRLAYAVGLTVAIVLAVAGTVLVGTRGGRTAS